MADEAREKLIRETWNAKAHLMNFSQRSVWRIPIHPKFEPLRRFSGDEPARSVSIPVLAFEYETSPLEDFEPYRSTYRRASSKPSQVVIAKTPPENTSG